MPTTVLPAPPNFQTLRRACNTIIKNCSNSWTIFRGIPHGAVVVLSKMSARARGTQAKLSQLYGSEGSPAVFRLHRLAEKSSKVKN